MVRVCDLHSQGYRFESYAAHWIYYAAVAHVVERISEKDEVAGARPARGTKCGCRIVAITPRCQRGDGSSILLTRSNKT